MFIYYVYAYMSNGLPYYIGKGKGYRAFSKDHTVSVPTDKTDIIFLETNLSNVGACAIERRMISWYGRLDIGTGILHNKTDGGEVGGLGYKHSEDSKVKMREAKIGMKLSDETRKKLRVLNKGKHVSEETRKKISESRKGIAPHNKEKLGLYTASKETRKKMCDSRKGQIPPFKGKSHSEETRKKLSEAAKGKLRGPYRKKS